MEPSIIKRFPQLKQVFINHKVKHAYLFGSVAKQTNSQKSDVDFLIRFKDGLDYETYTDNYFQLITALELLLQKEVDIVAEETLSNPYLIQSINQSKIQIL